MARIDPGIIKAVASDLAASYQDLADGQQWFDQLRALAERHGFAPSPQIAKAEPDRYPGSIREVAQIVRVALTGSTRSPDLHAVGRTLGRDEVIRRVRHLAWPIDPGSIDG